MAQLLSLAQALLTCVTKKHTIAAQCPTGIAKLRKELDIVQVSRIVIGTLVKGKLLASILAHVHGVGTTNGPNFLVVSPRHIGNSVPTRLDVRLLEIKCVTRQVGLVGTNQKLATVQGHPQTLFNVAFHKAHVLNPTRSAAIVGNPKLLTGFPGEEKVSTARHGQVGTQVVTHLIDNGTGKVRGTTDTTGTNSIQCSINGFLDLCLPVTSRIVGRVNGPRRCDHLGLVGSQGNDGGRFTGQFG
mmetsp:Transcript_22253/g.51287  ORF Transcript_22253/g.51287 Transcript_22253/m.51287 type:complete len:243 (+) Transcript_22253:72-800(+)